MAADRLRHVSRSATFERGSAWAGRDSEADLHRSPLFCTLTARSVGMRVSSVVLAHSVITSSLFSLL